MKNILALICFFCLTSCGKEAPPRQPVRPVRALKLTKEETIQTRVFPGRTRAVNRSNLSFRVDGPMIRRPVFVGDEVKKGQILAQIDPRDYEVRLQIARGNLARSEAQLRFARRDLQRATNIWKKDPGAISRSLLDQKNEEVNQLKGQIVSLEGEVEAAEDRLSDTNLLSPFDGIIVATFVEPFEFVNAKQPIIRLLDTSKVEMVIDVPESAISEIQNIRTVKVVFDAFPGREFEARIREIGTEASQTTRTFPVTVVMDQPGDVTILSGMAGAATLSGDEAAQYAEKGFLVPTTAVISDVDPSTTYVWLVNPETQRVYLQPVQKGKLLERGIMITGGLEEGDWVVASGANFLIEGQKVTLLPVIIDQQGRIDEMAD